MKPSTFFLLLLSVLFNGWVYAQPTLKTVIAGHITDIDASSSTGQDVSAFIGQFTTTKPDRTMTQVDEQGFFHMEVQTNRCEEVVIAYGGYWIPVIASPGDSVFLTIHAGGMKSPNPWNAIQVSGSHAHLQQQTLAFLTAFYDRFSGDTLDVQLNELAPTDYKAFALSMQEEEVRFLADYHKTQRLNDTILDWARQYVNLRAPRAIFRNALRRSGATGIYGLIGDGHFDYWESYRQITPQYVSSFRYQQFIATHSNYLNFSTFLAEIPSIAALDQETLLKTIYLKGDTIYHRQIDMLAQRPPDYFRDAALSLQLGNMLNRPGSAASVRPEYLDLIQNKRLRDQIRANYDLVHSQTAERSEKVQLLEVPDTVSDILQWIGLQFPAQVVVVDLWATWCGSCLYAIDKEYPTFLPQFEGEKVVFIFVGIDSQPNFLLARANRFPFVAKHIFPTANQDKLLADRYEVSGLPRIFLLERDGAIQKTHFTSPGTELEQAIRKALVE